MMATRLPGRCWRSLQSNSTLTRPTIILTERPSQPLLPRTARRGVKYGWNSASPRDLAEKYNRRAVGLPERSLGPAAALKRKERTTPVRTGVLAIKKGMTAFMGRTGARIPCTVLQLEQVQILGNKTPKKNGYWAVQVGLGERHPNALTAPMLGYFEAKGIAPKEHMAEFRVRTADGLLPVGVQIQPDWFHVGQWVDVRANCRGMGFAGGMKRHGFSGQEASHGNSLNHRTIGSVGGSQGSGSRVHPGKKMPGRMGGQQVTMQNLPVLLVNNDLGIVVVKGCVAGPKGAVVKIQDAVKKPPPPQEFVDMTRKTLDERFPNAKEQWNAARARHLELKRARREGTIDELLAKGVTEIAVSEPQEVSA